MFGCCARIASRLFFFPTMPAQRVGCSGQEVGWGHRWDSRPKLAKWIFCTVCCVCRNKNWGRGRRKGFFCFQCVFFLEIGGTLVCLWDVVNSFLSFACGLFWWFFSFPSSIKPSISQPVCFRTLVVSVFSPVPLWCGVSKQLCDCLAAGQGQPTPALCTDT